jgi:molybdenum cofactor cytidylyltransferase
MISAILLAAGQSRRMGAFKPLLPFGGKTVIECCVESLRGAGVEEIVVVAGHHADELRKSLAGSSVRFALNEEAASEMGVSVARGVERLSNEAAAVLIALADQPAISPEAIRAVIETYERTRAAVVVPRHRGLGGHPVLVDLKFREELSRLGGEKGLRGLMAERADEVARVEVDCPFVARDMDTWDDYVALHLRVFGVPPPVERPETD